MAKKKKQQSKVAAVKPKLAEKLKSKSVSGSVTGSGLKKQGKRLSAASDGGFAPRNKSKSREAEEMIIPSRSGDTIVVFSIDPSVDSSSPEKSPSTSPLPVGKKLTSRSRDYSNNVVLEVFGSGSTTNDEDPNESDRTKIDSPTSTDYKMDSDSSEECYDSYAASSEPINIQDVIMGDGDFTPLYLRYDSVINNALKSDESASAKPGNVKSSGVKEVVKEAESSAAPTSPSAVVFEPEPYVVTKRKGDSFYSAKNLSISSDQLSDDEELTVSVESCPTQASDAQTETPSSAQETMTPGQGKEWNTVRMSDCFVKVEKIQVQRDENDPTKVSGSPMEQTAPNVSSFEDQHNKLSQESSVTHPSSGPSSSAKPGPRGPVRRRAAPAQNSGKKMTSVSKTEENPGNIELVDDERGEKSKFTDRDVEIEPEKTYERRLSAEMVQARLSKEISVSQVQSVVHGASVVSRGQIADKRAGGGEMRSYNVSITPVIKKMDTSSPRSCELSADQSTVDEIQSEILEAMKVDPLGEDKSAHLPESVDTVSEKCVALSRPRRQTRAPKRIADAIKPKVNSRNSPASKAPPSAKANLSTLIEGKTAGQSKVPARTGEDRKKMKKLLSSEEHQSAETPIAEPKFLPSPSSEASSIGPAVNVPTGSAVAETAVSPAPLAHPQLPPPVEIPAKLGSTEPDVSKSAPNSAISTIIPAEGSMIIISSKPIKATLPAKLDDVTDNSKLSNDLSVEAGSNDRLVEIPPESLKSGIEPSNIAAGCAQETLGPTVSHPAEPPDSTRLSDANEKPPVDNQIPDLGADTPQVCDASSIRSAESVTTLAASALSSCSAPIIDDSSCKKDTDLKTLVPKANISENVKSSAAHSGSFKDNPLECLDLKNTDSQKPGLEPSRVGGNITSGSIAATEVPESTIVKGTFQEIPQTVVAPDNMEAVTKTQAALKEKSSESSNSPAATIKEQGQEPPMPQLPAIKEKRPTTPQTGIPKDKKKSVPLASPPVLPKEKSLESTTISAIKENKLGTQLAQTVSAKEKSVPHKQGIGSTAVVDAQGKSDLLPKSAPKTSGPEAIASAKSQPVKPAPSLKDPRSLTPKPSICKNPGTPDAPALGKVLVSSPQTIAKLKDNTSQQPDPASAQSQPSAQKPASDLVQKISSNLPKLTEVDIFNVATSPVKPLAAHAKKGLGSAKTAATPKSNDPPSKSFPAKPAEASANPDTPAFKTHPSIPKSPQTLPKSPVTPRPSPTPSKSSGAQPESDLPSSLAAEATPATAGVDAGVPVKVQTASLSLEVPASPKTEHPAAPKPVESPKTSPSKAHSSTKVVSASKASSPKGSSAPKSTGPRVATKAALKSFAAPKAQQSTKAAAKPPPQKSTKSAKAATPKGAKGIAKATAKLAMAQEVSLKVDQGSALADSKSEPDVKSPAAEFEAVRSAAKVGATKEEPAKATKTSKVETKKEKEAAKKVEGSTRRRSNRIRVNRWDEGPNIAAAAAASAAAAINSGQAETVSVNNPAAPSSMTAASQVSSKSVDSSANLLPPPPPPASGFEADKPVKVKSRWRRTSELEMGSRTSAHDPGAAIPTSPAPAGMSPSSPSPAPPPPPPSEPPPASSANSPTRPSSADLPLSAAADQVPFKAPLPVYDFDHPEIAERMKQFDVIRESIYLTERHQSKETKRMVCECTLSDEEVARGELGCGEDCLNRLLFIECSKRCTLGPLCSNKRFQNYENAKCTVIRTQDKGLGLIASSQIPGGEFLMEYVGEVIDPKEFRRRAKDYSKEKNRHFYFMSLKSDSIIDATLKGSISRFINHSCDPNAETQKWTVNGELRIGFFSKRQIHENEEITFDYQFQRYGKEAIRCFCGSANCRGWIGEDPDNKEKEEEKDQKWEKREKREKKKSREEVLEELEEEIEKLRLSGIKNRAHTLMLNRLMVRAEDHSSRSQLLAVTQAGVDQRCLRLFLDYHGLNLLWSWMVDHSAPTSVKIQILDTLSVLPITNKTILQDSKVLGVVERWSNSGDSTAEPKTRPEDEKEGSSPDSEETTNDGSATPSTEKKKCDVLDPDDPERQTLVAKATALFQGWSVLKEEFRIPKKQKIEQMKEHERDADRGYVDHEKAVKTENSYDRHWSFDKDRSKRRGRESPDSVEWKAKSSRSDEKNTGPRLSKSQRRQLFAMKVEEEERQKRMEEECWANHQEQCYALGVNPNMTYPPQANGGYYHHPLDGADVPPDVYGPGDPRGPPMYPPPPPSPFMGGPPPQQDPSYPPMSPFQQMNMGPSGPSPPGMGPPPGMGGPPPGMGGPPPGMSSMGPPPPGMVPHPSGMVPPGMPPGMQMMGMGPFGGPPSMPPFPPNGMPPMPVPYSNPPMPPQPNYAASPFAPSMVQALEPPPNGAIPLNSGGSMNKPAYIIKLPENWAIALDKERNAIYYYHRKTKHVQWHFPTVKDDKTEEAKLEKSGLKTAHADDSDDSEEEEEESESEEDESSSDEFEKEEEEDDDEYDDNQLLADAKRKAEEEMMIQNVVTEPSILIGEDAGVADVKMSDISIGSIAADTSQPTVTVPETGEPPPKKKREGLVTVNIISPRDEADDYRKGIKKSKIRETKMKLARQKAKAKAKARAAAAGHSGKVKVKRTKMCEADTSTGQSRKIKKFRSEMANVIVALLNPYMRPDCKMGRITTNEDFKHLARKLTHFVMVKELKHLPAIENLQCNDNVRHKAKDFIRKYMSKFGEVYSRLPDD